ncbi:MAG: hypothetical protein Q9M36_14045 [Sulfurovum sp.]|nr:hypothetical protein [Sulfurovum sp.]
MTVYLVIKMSLSLSHNIAVFWIFKVLGFYANYINKEDEALNARFTYFAQHLIAHIKEAEKNDIDEILLIAHSAGNIVFINLVSDILNAFALNDKVLSRISIMTLGQCIPMVSLQEGAEGYRQKLEDISAYHLRWLDYTSAIDPLVFYLYDFFERGEEKAKIHFLSPRFHTLYESKRYAQIKRGMYLAHFLYLMSNDKIGKYNYFRMTAGEKCLNEWLDGEKKV